MQLGGQTMRKILATLIAIASLGYSSAFAGTLVINTDTSDPAPKAAFEWIIKVRRRKPRCNC